MATYADTNTVKQENIVLTPKDKKGKKITLAVKIETQWLKVGNKLVVKYVQLEVRMLIFEGKELEMNQRIMFWKQQMNSPRQTQVFLIMYLE